MDISALEGIYPREIMLTGYYDHARKPTNSHRLMGAQIYYCKRKWNVKSLARELPIKRN
jgi:hypothetical protein